MENRKYITAGLVVTLAVIVVLVILAALKPRVNTELVVAPDTATVTLEDGTSLASGTAYITPGKHTATATLDGFTDAKQTFVVDANSKPVQVNLLLNPTTQDAYDYLSNHPEQEQLRETLGGASYTNGSAEQQKSYPIISLLPYDGLRFSINYGRSEKNPDNPAFMALYVRADDEAAVQRATNWIRFSGYDPNDYEIIYQASDTQY